MPIERFIWTTHAQERRAKRLLLTRYPEAAMIHLHYDPEVDIAMISFEDGRASSEEFDWGLIDRHPDDGHLMGFEIWEASKILPPEMIAALPLAGQHSAPAA